MEDNEDLSRMYERAFRLSGHTIEVAFDGAEALEKLQTMAELPNAILLDVFIPKISGFDVLRTLKQDEKTKYIPVTILTNTFKSENGSAFMTLGANLYIIKIDYDAKEVVHKIEQLLAGIDPKIIMAT